MYGAIEAGGTKFVCALGENTGRLVDRVEIPTRQPDETLRDVVRYFAGHRDAGREIASLGIGSFGPIETDPGSARYGEILGTPKPGWAGTRLREYLATALRVPVVVDTDVNAAALAEYRWGTAQGLLDVLYVTVGTGIGVGALLGGRIYSGMHHPEMGHMRIPVSPDEPEGFKGCCPYHGACVEGMASGAALVQRWGKMLAELPHEHAAWALESEYLATFFSNLTFAFQPQRIIVGGGVTSPHLLALVRRRLYDLLGAYHASLGSEAQIEHYVVMPKLGKDVGVLGALLIAQTTREVERAMLAGEMERQSDA